MMTPEHAVVAAMLTCVGGALLAPLLARRGAPAGWVMFLAVAGVPLFSGFASKWTIYTAAIQGSSHAPFLPVCVIVATFTSGLTLAVFALIFVGVRVLAGLGGAVQRPATPWLCGYAREAEVYRYRAGGLFREIRTLLRWPVKTARPRPAPVKAPAPAVECPPLDAATES